MATLSRETLMLRQLWLKAAKAKAPLVMPTESIQAAQQLRLKFYSAVKAVRAETEHNPELLQATQDCSLSLDSKDHRVLRIGRKEQLSSTVAMLEKLLGTPMKDLETPEAEQARKSLERFLEANPEGSSPPANPYYKRD